MPLDPSIILQASAKPFDAAGAVQGAYKLKDLIDSSRLSQLKSEETAGKLATNRSLAALIPTLADPFGKDANTIARVMAQSDPEGAVKFQTGAVQHRKAESDAEKARVENWLTQADVIARVVNGVRQLPPEQRAGAYQRSLPMLEQAGLKAPPDWNEELADQQLSLAMSVKDQFAEQGRRRDDERQDLSTRDLIRHRGVVEDQGERRLSQTASHQGVMEDQGERRLDNSAADDERLTRDRVLAPILDKVARGIRLSSSEQQALELASSPTDRRGRSRYRPPVGGEGAGPMLDANGNVPNPAGLNTPPLVARRAPPARTPTGSQPRRVRLPDGYTPQRAVAEARAALKANPANRRAIADRLQSYGINPNALGK